MRILAKDGVSLNVLATEMRYENTVVFVNALGISCLVAGKLIDAFDANKINFVTWDLRGSPGDGDGFREYTTSHHVDDLAAIVETLGAARVVLVSWCSGGAIALSAVSERRLTPLSLAVFCVPNYAGVPRHLMAGNTIDRVCSVIANDEDKLNFFYDAIVARSGMDRVTAEIEDERLQAYVLAPFKGDPKAMLKFAHAVNNRPKPEVVTKWCASIRVPTVFYGGKKDTLVSYRDSIELSKFVPGSVCKIFDEWTHYSLFNDMTTVVSEVQRMFQLDVAAAR